MKANILYIEDHPDNMTLVRRILLSESYNLIEANRFSRNFYRRKPGQ
jgi:response regulator RpfG family c-di-GMP phosphodiesterase